MKTKKSILEKHLTVMGNTIGVKIPENTNEFVLRAMQEYAESFSEEVLNAVSMDEKKFLWLFPRELFAFWWTNFILRRRAKNLKSICRSIQKLSNQDKRKYYVIRASQTGYKVLSVADVKHNKAIRVFGKHVDAIKLAETADRVITPKNH